jgi:hypothetical protein
MNGKAINTPLFVPTIPGLQIHLVILGTYRGAVSLLKFWLTRPVLKGGIAFWGGVHVEGAGVKREVAAL